MAFKLRDRDSNPNLPDQNRASLPIGLSRKAVRVARKNSVFVRVIRPW